MKNVGFLGKLIRKRNKLKEANKKKQQLLPKYIRPKKISRKQEGNVISNTKLKKSASFKIIGI